MNDATCNATLEQVVTDDQDKLQLEALLLARAYLYTLFHKLLGATPEEDVLEALFDDMTFDSLDEFADASSELEAFGALLSRIKDEAREDGAAYLDHAKDEYTRVFVGPLALPASPYESPYTGAHDMATFQENTLDVRALYHEQGYKVRREQAVPDDHVSLMCMFAALVSKEALAQLCAGDYSQLAFTLHKQCLFSRDHMANWLDVYARSVRNSKAGAQAVLYPQLLEALAAFVRVDVEFLTESAYWAEGRQGAAQPVSLTAEQPIDPQLAEAQRALEKLESIRPFGIQDNELVSL